MPPPSYRIFLDALPIWTATWLWSVLLVPLCLAVAIVYKSIRCPSMRRVPREAAELFVFIIVGMAATALALVGLARIMQ